MNEIWIGAISALLGSAIGAIVVLVQAYLNYREKKEERRENLLLKGIDKLNRDEVQRSIGISIIEGLKIKDKEELDLIIPTLASQALFLLMHTENNKSRVEYSNWIRIMKLLKEPEWMKKNFPYLYNELSNAFYLKHESDSEKGIEMPTYVLEIWAEKYGMDIHSPKVKIK